MEIQKLLDKSDEKYIKIARLLYGLLDEEDMKKKLEIREVVLDLLRTSVIIENKDFMELLAELEKFKSLKEK
jgi:hypothetical protein